MVGLEEPECEVFESHIEMVMMKFAENRWWHAGRMESAVCTKHWAASFCPFRAREEPRVSEKGSKEVQNYL